MIPVWRLTLPGACAADCHQTRRGPPVEAPADLTWTGGLIWALCHPDGDRAVLAANALGLRAREAVPALRGAVEGGNDTYLRAAALRSLIAVEGVQSLRPWLDELSKAAPFNVRAIARRAPEEAAIDDAR